MKKAFFFLLILVLSLSQLTTSMGSGDVVTLPLDKDPCFGIIPENLIYEEGIADPVGYQDPSISVHLERGHYQTSDYLVVRIKITDPSQIRSVKFGKYEENNTVVGSTLARKVSAVFAMNGDYFNTRSTGFVFRQGKLYRKNCHGGHDVLIIDEKGDLNILCRATNADIDQYKGTIVNGYTFGPCLVLDGKKRTDQDYAYFDVGMYKKTQRIALCQTGPLEYMCVACCGPENKGSTGMTLDEFADLLMSFGNVKVGYNMDGASSATAIFVDRNLNYIKINARDSKVRDIKDLIYFASAWDPNAESFLVIDDEDE